MQSQNFQVKIFATPSTDNGSIQENIFDTINTDKEWKVLNCHLHSLIEDRLMGEGDAPMK